MKPRSMPGKAGAITRLSILAIVLMVAGCRGTTTSGAAGNRVDPMGGSDTERSSGMDHDSNRGGGY